MSDLLKVLDMSEAEQIEWLNKNLIDYGYNGLGCETFADLAFRLRDEARKTNLTAWYNAIYLVASHINDSPLSDYGGEVPSEIWQWAQHIILNQSEYSLAIIWIVAALIAKERKK